MRGFLANIDEFHAASDAELGAWSAFLRRWWIEKSDRPVGVSDLFYVASNLDPPLDLGDGREHSQKICLGRLIAGKRNRPVLIDLERSSGQYQLCVRSAGAAARAQLWRLQAMDA